LFVSATVKPVAVSNLEFIACHTPIGWLCTVQLKQTYQYFLVL
jgi:hypothetical protein